MLQLNVSLSPGHHGTIPCSPDHGEAAGPMGPAVDRILSFVSSVRAPFAPLATPSGDRPATVRGSSRAGGVLVCYRRHMWRLTVGLQWLTVSLRVTTQQGITWAKHLLIVSNVSAPPWHGTTPGRSPDGVASGAKGARTLLTNGKMRSTAGPAGPAASP